MTISSTTRVAGPFLGDGTTATFPFTFKVFDAADLLVVTLNLATGAIATLALETDYTAALNANQDTTPGGSITLTGGNLATGLTLTITTDMAQLQGLDLTNAGGFYPNVMNAAFDTVVIQIQQLQVEVDGAIRIPFGDNAAMLLPARNLRAGKLLGFDAAGNVALISVAGGSIVPGAQTSPSTVDGDNQFFTFTAPAGATPSILVFAGGIFQDPATDYSTPTFVSGTTWQIVFTVAPVNGPIKILMLG
jgi:hypothetical protein